MLLLPCAQQAPQDDEFAGVIGGVVGDQEGLSQQRLVAVSPWKGSGEFFIVRSFEELLEGFAVFANVMDGLLPGIGVRGLGIEPASRLRATCEACNCRRRCC